MPAAYSRIAFTPSVKALQERLGSREQYAFLDGVDPTDEPLGEREAAFIESRDTLFQATVGETGWPYVQHRGGPVGFIRVLDPYTIAYPDYRGNVQYLSAGNLVNDDRMSIILLDPARKRRLKLLGHASLVERGTHPELVDQLQLGSDSAQVERVFVVRIVGFDWNCPQHIVARFTEEEIAAMTAALRLRVQRAERQVAELTRPVQAALRVAPPIGHGPLPLVITAVRQLTPRVKAYELRHAEGKKLPPIEAGSHIGLPVLTPAGAPAIRHYSISSAPGERLQFEVAVLREMSGRGGSAFAHDVWEVGTELRAEYPRNHFQLARDASHCLLIAGGIGITPLRSMALQLLHEGRSFELHHLARSTAEAAYAQTMSSTLRSRYTLHASERGGRVDLRQLLQKSMPEGTHIYVCGPSGLVSAVREEARRLGLPESAFHSERFGLPQGESADSTVEVHLRRSGKTVQVGVSESILEAVERIGVTVPASCRIGVCGTCAVRVLGGQPDHRDDVLDTADPDRGERMCICVSRAYSSTLEIDL